MRKTGGSPGRGSHRVFRLGHRRHRLGPPAPALLPRRIRRPRRWKPMIGTELLDDPRADPELVGRELRDIARLNALFGGTRAVVRELEPFFERGKREAWTLLDVGTGLGDIPRAAAAAARRHGITLRLVGIELNRTAARLALGADGRRGAPLAVALADGAALPRGPRSVDVVVASQVLHHVPRAVAVRCIVGLDRVSRRPGVLGGRRRSPAA